MSMYAITPLIMIGTEVPGEEDQVDAVLSREAFCSVKDAGLIKADWITWQWEPILSPCAIHDAAYLPYTGAHQDFVASFDRAAAQIGCWVKAGKRVLVLDYACIIRAPSDRALLVGQRPNAVFAQVKVAIARRVLWLELRRCV